MVHNFKMFVFQEYIVKYRYIMVYNFKMFGILIKSTIKYKFIMVHNFKAFDIPIVHIKV